MDVHTTMNNTVDSTGNDDAVDDEGGLDGTNVTILVSPGDLRRSMV